MKAITESFTIKMGYKNKEYFTITARNFNTHLLDISRNTLPVTVTEMRAIADHLNRIANIIVEDKDFNKQT